MPKLLHCGFYLYIFSDHVKLSLQVSDRAWVLEFSDFKLIVGKCEFLWANHYAKIFCFCGHSGVLDFIYSETSSYEHIL